MLPHGAKRSFHFAREGTLVAHCGRCHARAQSATQVVQAPWIAGERDGDLDILLCGVGNQIRHANLGKQAGANPSSMAITP